MKTKNKKDWLKREKSIEELHYNSTEWISEIDFINDEIQFLNHLLSRKYIDYLEAGLSKRIEVFSKKLVKEITAGKTLRDLIYKHEIVLANLIENNSDASTLNYLDTYKKLEIEVETYFKKYRNLKKRIFEVVEKVMKRKNQKKLA